MSPEQASGRSSEIDGRTDLFALTATLFRVRTGRRIHEASNPVDLVTKMASLPAPPIRSVCPDVSSSFERVVDKGLQFDKENRYKSAAEMSGDVRRALAELEGAKTQKATGGEGLAPCGESPPSSATVELGDTDIVRSQYGVDESIRIPKQRSIVPLATAARDCRRRRIRRTDLRATLDRPAQGARLSGIAVDVRRRAVPLREPHGSGRPCRVGRGAGCGRSPRRSRECIELERDSRFRRDARPRGRAQAGGDHAPRRNAQEEHDHPHEAWRAQRGALRRSRHATRASLPEVGFDQYGLSGASGGAASPAGFATGEAGCGLGAGGPGGAGAATGGGAWRMTDADAGRNEGASAFDEAGAIAVGIGGRGCDRRVGVAVAVAVDRRCPSPRRPRRCDVNAMAFAMYGATRGPEAFPLCT